MGLLQVPLKTSTKGIRQGADFLMRGEAPVFNEPGVHFADADADADGTVHWSKRVLVAVRTPGPRRARRAAVRAAAGLSGPGRGLGRDAAITGMPA